MTKQQFRELLSQGPLILDGATGSNLRMMGMPAGVCTEKWVNEHPETIQKLQKAYVDAGSMVVYAPTFMANRISLKNVGLEEEIERFNKEFPNVKTKMVDFPVQDEKDGIAADWHPSAITHKKAAEQLAKELKSF